jgi:amino acid transporter
MDGCSQKVKSAIGYRDLWQRYYLILSVCFSNYYRLCTTICVVSTAMLGISGFESSANFVEEQAPGVFPKTLRNMWLAVSIINPLMALTAIIVLPLADVWRNSEALLSHLGNTTGGCWLAIVVSVDAILVLSGAVLTSYVGVGGLMKRMTLDRIFPQPLLKENKNGDSPRIFILFFLLCLSVLFITQGKLGPLAGVYTISFLLVMIYFGIGNFLLKIKRAGLNRLDKAYPAIDIDYIQINGIFGPDLIKQLSQEWDIPTNFMFISSPGSSFPHQLADMHGVRLII